MAQLEQNLAPFPLLDASFWGGGICMKFWLATVLSLCALLAQDTPQNQPASEESSEPRGQAVQRIMELQERLNLTPEQKAQVVPVFRDELLQEKAVRDEYGNPRDANLRTKLKMARKIKGIESETDKKLATILNEAQMKEIKQFRAEVKEARKP
jgi:hypothetical protein